jgi:hypothetical protein
MNSLREARLAPSPHDPLRLRVILPTLSPCIEGADDLRSEPVAIQAQGKKSAPKITGELPTHKRGSIRSPMIWGRDDALDGGSRAVPGCADQSWPAANARDRSRAASRAMRNAARTLFSSSSRMAAAVVPAGDVTCSRRTTGC